MEDLPWKVYTLSPKNHISLEKMKGILNSRSLLLRTIGKSKNMTDLENQHMKEDQIKAQSINLSLLLSNFLYHFLICTDWLVHTSHVHSAHITEIHPKHVTCCFHSMPSTFAEFLYYTGSYIFVTHLFPQLLYENCFDECRIMLPRSLSVHKWITKWITKFMHIFDQNVDQ